MPNSVVEDRRVNVIFHCSQFLHGSYPVLWTYIVIALIRAISLSPGTRASALPTETTAESVRSDHLQHASHSDHLTLHILWQTDRPLAVTYKEGHPASFQLLIVFAISLSLRSIVATVVFGKGGSPSRVHVNHHHLCSTLDASLVCQRISFHTNISPTFPHPNISSYSGVFHLFAAACCDWCLGCTFCLLWDDVLRWYPGWSSAAELRVVLPPWPLA